MNNMFYRALSAPLLAGLLATSASASTVYNVDFTATIDRSIGWPEDHEYSISIGDQFHGTLQYDASYLVGGEDWERLALGQGFNSLSFDFFGTTYDETDHSYADFPPDLFFSSDGELIDMGYGVIVDSSIRFGFGEGFGVFGEGNEFAILGDVEFFVQSNDIPEDPTIIPLPAAVWGGMALFGMLGAGGAIRRRFAGQTEPV
ncbi:hypothetical protein ACERK3_02865 [Phycisphaerales bacterium AB-hyl4]|uniref:Secreted protein n=1 Tax=Natronomicrosphaera hydrolytica TaxID=3242702 RepID=A0ABV4U0W1_9BACT